MYYDMGYAMDLGLTAGSAEEWGEAMKLPQAPSKPKPKPKGDDHWAMEMFGTTMNLLTEVQRKKVAEARARYAAITAGSGGLPSWAPVAAVGAGALILFLVLKK